MGWRGTPTLQPPSHQRFTCSPLVIAEIDDDQKTSQMIIYSLLNVRQLWPWTGFHSLRLHANTKTVTGGESEGRSSQIISLSLSRLRSPLPRSPAPSLFSFCPRALWCSVGDLGGSRVGVDALCLRRSAEKALRAQPQTLTAF